MASRRRIWTLILLMLGCVALLASGPPPASAVVSGPCTATVRINGRSYGPQNGTPSRAIPLPPNKDVTLTWEAQTARPIHNYQGEADVKLGPVTLTVETWKGRNAESGMKSSGGWSATLPLRLSGLYKVTVRHKGSDGSCEAVFYVKIKGSPLATIPGLVSVVGVGLAALGVLVSGLAKRRRA
jgi:hypothetical protein